MTTGAAVIGTMTGRMMMKETIPGTAEGNGTMRIRTEAGSAAETETGTVTAAAGMTVMMAMTGTAGEAVQHALQSTRAHIEHPVRAGTLQSALCSVYVCAVGAMSVHSPLVFRINCSSLQEPAWLCDGDTA